MIDLLIIGSGIIGSWLALEAARHGLAVAICDRQADPRDGITGRNSGVLHAGIYYPPDSLKAEHCLRGWELAVSFARRHGVPFELCGKLIVSGRSDSPEEEAGVRDRIEKLYNNARNAGAQELEIIEHPGRQYPHVLGSMAILSKRTGVIDVPAYHRAVRNAAESAGAMFLMKREFRQGESGRADLIDENGRIETIQTAHIINAAGLDSDVVASGFGLKDYSIRPNRGEYYRLNRTLPYAKLIYPLPSTESTALGVHYTFQLNGEAYAGPNSVWAEHKQDYRISMERSEFYQSLSRILDCYQETDLNPGYSGLRPRLFKGEQPIRDFVIAEFPDRVHHLLGIESPGLTSSPSLAEMMIKKILRN
ncbi:MAG: FAD-dependent oxidoreductase [Leptospiraceae bacterium]|nr:FAD-dependent oxidoreductase [Leptospiraceae bacterium]